ncbi:hypothetical protein CUC15_16360 [Oceanobacillus zhaokaii]|uniref:VanZ-like domain-containing protein n=2 Tax=Oceanobacillus zhaokaii TaxID=2052660 RepID=A0A345PK79_9BACI|nr:hypothetical protein CUC15_16360 [Oceanobacillus zhaokaii]
MLIGLCTEDVYALFANGEISFSFTWTPNWEHFLQLYPIDTVSSFELFGHFIIFFILTCLIIEVVSNYAHILVAAFTFAIFTEIIQVFFGRGADLYDILMDLLGIVVAIGDYYRLEESS